MRNLGLRGPGDDFLEPGALFFREFLHRRERDDAFGQACIDERKILLQDDAAVLAPGLRHFGLIEAVERRLQAHAKTLHRSAPGLACQLVDVRPRGHRDHHRAVADGFEELIDARNRWCVERRHARPIQNEAPAGAGEQSQDDGMLGENVFPEHRAEFAIEAEHCGVQGQNILRSGLPGARALAADDHVHVRGSLGLLLAAAGNTAAIANATADNNKAQPWRMMNPPDKTMMHDSTASRSAQARQRKIPS